MRRIRGALAAAMLLSAAAAAAQDVAPPPPVEPPGPAEPARGRGGQGLTVEGARRGGWMLDLAVQGDYESSVPFAPVLGEDDYVSRVNGRLAHAFALRRGTLEIGADGGGAFYRTVTGLNRFTWAAYVTGQQRLARRLSATLQARSAQAYARDDPRLTLAGTLPPLVPTRSDTGLVDVRWEFTRSWRLAGEGRIESFRFGSYQPVSADGTTPAAEVTPPPGSVSQPPLVLRDGWTAAGRTMLEHLWSRRTSLGTAFQYERTSTLGQTVEVLSAFATANLPLMRDLDLRAEGGVARTGGLTPVAGVALAQPVASSDNQFTPAGLAALAWHGGSHALDLELARRVQQAYGVGTIGIARSGTLTYVLLLHRAVKFNLSGTLAQNEGIDSSLQSRSRSVAAGFDFALPGGLAARTTYSYWSMVDPFHTYNDQIVSVALSYRLDWR